MSYIYNPMFPTFEVDGTKFALSFQEDEEGGTDVTLLIFNGTAWANFGDGDNDGVADGGMIAEMITDEMIMAHGSLKSFMQWCLDEAMRRAIKKAAIPLPDPNNRLERMKYAILKIVKVQQNEHDAALSLPNGPLP